MEVILAIAPKVSLEPNAMLTLMNVTKDLPASTAEPVSTLQDLTDVIALKDLKEVVVKLISMNAKTILV
jgi:hypothetical protein